MSGRGLRRLVVAAVGVAAVAFLLALFQPFAGDGGERVRVSIARDSGLGTIADTLDDAGVIGNKTLFKLRARLSGSADSLKPGVYYLREDSPYGDVLDKLEEGPAKELIQVTIPEGLSRREVAPIVGRAGVRGNYVAATSSARLPPGFRGERIPDKEGFMFPATYELRSGGNARTLVQKQAAAFAENFGSVDLSYARRKNLTPYDVLKIASMVEREAQLDKERPLVAAVIYNRLKQGQPLGIDATIRYATGNWTEPLKQSELSSDSAFNTRTRAGLPPTPIGNPGLASLRAAARPAKVDYLYYVVKPGTCGQHAFSSTFEQFEQDQAKYNAAREAAGGSRPRPVRRDEFAVGSRQSAVMKRVALLGWPVGHSRSPAMQNAAFAAAGLDWSYELLGVEPERFDEVVRGMPREGFAGANVTIPHKLAALEIADSATEVAQHVGAANTLTFADGRIEADNTDVAGLEASLAERAPGVPAGMRCLVLGAGGAARAAVYGLLRGSAASVAVWNRTPARAAELVESFRQEAVSQALEAAENPDASTYDLILNATSVGMARPGGDHPGGEVSDPFKALPLSADELRVGQMVVDLVYRPGSTELALAARERGLRCVDGFDVLVHQGAASFRRWTGREAPLEVMRRAARDP